MSIRLGFLNARAAIAMALAMSFVAPISAQVFFDGGTGNPGNWEDAANWSGDALPTNSSGRTLIAAGDDAALPGGVPATATVNLASTQTIDELRVGTRGGSDGTLNVSSGKLSTNWVFAGIQGGEDGGGGAVGRINLSGTGELDANGNVSLFGADPGGNRAELTVADDAIFRGNETWIGLNQAAEGVVTQTGGLVAIGPHDDPNARAELRVGGDSNGFGIYDISGGRLEASDQGIYVGKNDDGIGSFRINGSDASITTSNFAAGGFWDFPSFPDLVDGTGVDTTGSATILFTVDSVTGVTAVDVTGDMFLGDQALLGVIGGTLPAGNIPLFNVGGSRTGDEFSNAPEGTLYGGGTHAISYLAGDGNDIWLVDTSIPEPTSLLLAAIGLFAALADRRRSRQ